MDQFEEGEDHPSSKGTFGEKHGVVGVPAFARVPGVEAVAVITLGDI